MEVDLGYQNTVVVFDIDDTLYQEIDYVLSAYTAIDSYLSPKYLLPVGYCFDILKNAFETKVNPFDTLSETLSAEKEIKNINISELVSIYRFHIPDLTLSVSAKTTLNQLQQRGLKLGIITDGRSQTQRNKLKVLGLEKYFAPQNIIVSEEIGYDKTSSEPFRHFVNRYPNSSGFVYVGDNPAKDFYHPNLMGWQTVMLLDKGNNIHSQKESLSPLHLSQFKINEITELLEII